MGGFAETRGETRGASGSLGLRVLRRWVAKYFESQETAFHGAPSSSLKDFVFLKNAI